ALSSSSHRPSIDEVARLHRLAAELAQAEADTILLVQAQAGAPELKVRLAGAGADKSLHEPDVAAPSLGLYLFRTSSSDAPEQLVARLSITPPSELAPARPIRASVDVLPANGALFSVGFTLPSDGTVIARAR